jgi:transcriptional regulator with XRE-family HTH domain
MKAAMEEKGLSTRDLAERLGCTYNHLNLCGKDERLPSDDMVARICKALDLDYDKIQPFVLRARLERKLSPKAK